MSDYTVTQDDLDASQKFLRRHQFGPNSLVYDVAELIHWDASALAAANQRAATAEQRLAALMAILNKRRAEDDLCECERCAAIITISTPHFKCDLCGYAGAPVAMDCACYDYRCSGGGSRGAGCFHGVLRCPACDDGDSVSGWDVIRELRAALTAA